jgi:AmmeMemoRadiSam system protein B
MFYPGETDRCQATARYLIESQREAILKASPENGSQETLPLRNTPRNTLGVALGDTLRNTPALGGIVPHAGWICSGQIAAQTIAAIALTRPQVDVVVIFGAVHTPLRADGGVFDSHQSWQIPGAMLRVGIKIRDTLLARSNHFMIDDRFHEREHAVEVELPLIQQAWPGATILPIEIPLIESAGVLGEEVARAIHAANLSAIYLASSDLTHYGPSYNFAPAGVGPQGLAWAKENDRRFLQVITDLTVARIVPHVRNNASACGGGAIAAMMSACLAHGAKTAKILSQTNSFETLASVAPQPPDNAVGYSALILS